MNMDQKAPKQRVIVWGAIAKGRMLSAERINKVTGKTKRDPIPYRNKFGSKNLKIQLVQLTHIKL